MLTAAEKERVRYHLAYTQVAWPAQLSLGWPLTTQADFLVNANMDNLSAPGETIVREAVRELDCILGQISANRQTLVITQVDTTKFAGGDGLEALWNEYRRWRLRLADTVGAQVNPVSNQVAFGGGGGVMEPM
jgi:hypothetical protein